MAKTNEKEFDPKLTGMSNDAIGAATGKGWAEWVALINAWPGSSEGHTAVAAWVAENDSVDGWWAQGITVGWERLTGRRKLHQQADGTFSSSTSRTFRINFEQLREQLRDDDKRSELLGLNDTAVSSRPDSKSVRIKFDDTTILFGSYPGTKGRTRLSVTHEQLKSPADVEKWKLFWSDWIKALPES